ncbi:MAG TPA: serine hydrolase [Patescibacteria group bacterium]|nr:serine hydrolase [Patescibacteria group bacterium]
MKKSFLIFLAILLLSPKQVLAATASKVNVSDIIYADLALRHNLDNVSIYYTDGKSDTVKLNEERHWLPASTVKTFAAMYAYKLISQGKLNLTDSVTIDAKNDVPTELVTDQLPTLLEGDSVTIDRLIRQMITQSDNTAFNQLLDILGRDNITEYIQSLGLSHSHVGSKLNLDTSQEQYEFDTPGYGINTTTAEDYAKAFQLIKNNKIPGAKDLFAVLKDQKINNMIPLLLPKNVVCAHKTGDLDPLYHDGGICQDKKRSYVLTIFTNAGDPNLLAHLSELIYTKNINLVGEDISAIKPLSSNPQDNHPLDPLVMKPVDTAVLGANTINLPTPDITAADLGVTANDLSLVIKDKDLPPVVIPADSPFHALSDAWQLTRIFVAPGAKARLAVNLDIARLRVAEANDLVKRGKTTQAQVILQNMQQGFSTVAKDPSVTHDSTSQNTIQAVSETRFAVLGNELKQTQGDTKAALIKAIATQAKETIQNVQPNIPDATNAINPAQKPLIGEIVKTTDTSITVKTAGGQELIVPTNTGSLVIKEKQAAPQTPISTVAPTSPDTTPSISETVSPTQVSPTSTSNTKSLTVGSTIALVGSTTNNTFAPSLILTNIPKELSAPQPVTVAKVDTKHNTMVVVENGVYTQVNVSKDTNIKGADTDIPLKAIQPGDVVVVHGEPLTQNQPTQSPTASPTPSGANTAPQPSAGQPNQPISPTQSSGKNSPSTTPVPAVTATNQTTSTPVPHVTIPISHAPSSKLTPTTTTVVSPTTNKTIVPKTVPSAAPSSPQPKIIQSTSIQVVETKISITNAPAPKINTPAAQPSAPSQPSQNKPQQQSQPQSQPPQTVQTKTDQKKTK